MALVWASWTLCFVLAFFHSAMAREFVVGGRKGWVVPSGGEPQTYNHWAGRNRFMVGDTLLFKYNPAEDSVLQVTAHQYDACNTSSPIASFKGGNTVFNLSRHGPLHFITGNRSNCQKGEKLTVVVLAPRNRSHGAPAHAPTAVSPGPSVVAASPSAPAPAPTTKVPSSSPSPAPVVSAPSPSPVPVGAAPSPSSSPAPLAAVSPPLSSPALSPPSPSPLTATPSPSTATPLASQNTPTASPPPPSASPPTLVTALNLVMPLLFALKILTIY